jgi:5-methylcytosine-specific restriction endonuclease McrA
MSDWFEHCDCGRGYYDPSEYSTCYECFQDRRSDYMSCIFCGKWHSPKFDTCFDCRRVSQRDEAGRALRFEILIRDNFTCREPGCGSQEQLQIDHIKPCDSGGTADPWNLQVLCHECNRMKGRTWAREVVTTDGG